MKNCSIFIKYPFLVTTFVGSHTNLIVLQGFTEFYTKNIYYL